MSEKEERIFIGFINPEGDACPVPYGKCNSLCDNCQGGMTHSEAIEKMRKGFVTKYRGYFYCEPKHPNISDCLEAALDELLEG